MSIIISYLVSIIFLIYAQNAKTAYVALSAPFNMDSNMRRVTSRIVTIPKDDGMEEGDSLDDVLYFDETDDGSAKRGKKNTKLWDHWGKWSPCSVTCGVGKMVRWRHCVSDGCAPGEKEAQIKTCTMSPC